MGVSLPSSAICVNAATSVILHPHILKGADESAMNFRSLQNTKRPKFGLGKLSVSGLECSQLP